MLRSSLFRSILFFSILFYIVVEEGNHDAAAVLYLFICSGFFFKQSLALAQFSVFSHIFPGTLKPEFALLKIQMWSQIGVKNRGKDENVYLSRSVKNTSLSPCSASLCVSISAHVLECVLR